MSIKIAVFKKQIQRYVKYISASFCTSALKLNKDKILGPNHMTSDERLERGNVKEVHEILHKRRRILINYGQRNEIWYSKRISYDDRLDRGVDQIYEWTVKYDSDRGDTHRGTINSNIPDTHGVKKTEKTRISNSLIFSMTNDIRNSEVMSASGNRVVRISKSISIIWDRKLEVFDVQRDRLTQDHNDTHLSREAQTHFSRLCFRRSVRTSLS